MDPDSLRRRVEQSRSMCGTSLKLGIADITDEYAVPIIEVVKKRRILEVQLYGNSITNIGCEVFATLLRLRDTNCNLRKLNLHNNDVGNEGAIAIANSLTNNNKLKTLATIHLILVTMDGLLAMITRMMPSKEYKMPS